MMLWLLFKTKIGKKQRITVPTLMHIGYGKNKVNRAQVQRETRKRLLRTFESDLEILNNYGIKPVFDPVTYQPEIQPLWTKLAAIPDDPDEAMEFWIEDGIGENSLTSSGPAGKWHMLMKARILYFELPPAWDRQLAKLTTKKERKSTAYKKTKVIKSGLSADQISSARKDRGMSQRALAQMTGKSQSWIRDVEKGRFAAKPKDQELLREALGLH